MSLVLNRRFFQKVKQWRVGTAAGGGAYSYVGESSALGPVWWQPIDNTINRITLQGASFALKIFDNINYDLEGWLQIGDIEAVTQLLRTIDVVAGGGVETAVEWDSTPTRNWIAYFAIIIDTIEIVNAADTRTVPETSFVFSGNVVIESIHPRLDDPNGSWLVHWYADYVTQTDA